MIVINPTNAFKIPLLLTNSNISNPQCYGSNSCREARIYIDISEDRDIECYGGYSCYKISSIVQIIGGGDIQCNVAHSCSSIENGIYITGNPLYCEGDESCIGMKINSTGSLDIICEGEKSCELIEINYELDDWIDCDGAISCRNSYFSTNNTKDLTPSPTQDESSDSGEDGPTFRLDFRGFNSGSGSTLICKRGITCEIYCDGTGCDNINIICENCTDIFIWCNGPISPHSQGVCGTDGM